MNVVELFETPWHVFGATLVFLSGAVFFVKAAPFFYQSAKRAFGLYLWHTLFCFAYMYFVLQSGGDALMYYRTSIVGGFDFSLGTRAVQYLTMFFSSILGLSLLGVFLAFNIFGSVGLLAFDASLKSVTAEKGKAVRLFATLIVFLPSVSFWSSGIGKDAISFAAAGLALWAALNFYRRSALMVLAVLLMLMVRPHMAAIMVMAIAMSMMLQPGVSILQRILFGGFAAAAAAVVVPFALGYAGVAGLGVQDFTEYVDLRQSYNMEGGGGIDIGSMSLPMKMFTYLFRPLPFEAHSITALIASIDNVVLVILAGIAFVQVIKRRRRAFASNNMNSMFYFIYSISAWVVLSLTTANLGISVRQKWMFAPMLILLCFYVLGRSRARISNSSSLGSKRAYE